jgi:HlyD family secretion protein
MKSLLILFAAVALAGCSRNEAPAWTGYAEGDAVYVAAPVAGRLSQLAVRSGDTVGAGQLLFQLDDSLERAAGAEAQARAQSAAAQARNTETGRRREELAVLEAQVEQARAQVALAQAELQRQQQLVAQGFVQRAQVEDAALQLRQAQARHHEAEAALGSGRLPARDDERSSARALAAAASQAQAQADWRLQQMVQRANAPAQVIDTYHQPGEWVAAGTPVLGLLPAEGRKVRFFVPQAELGQAALGANVQLLCDGCGAPIAARVSFVSPRPEYTPPVIYSGSQRSKLVVMVEARPVRAEDARRLQPGQPVDAKPAGTP